MSIKPLNRITVPVKERPIKVLQFGEGNFLRAFVDWQLDIANEKGVINTNIAVLVPRFGESRVITLLQQQGGRYHVYLEGIENGQPKKESRLITSVVEAFSPSFDFPLYEKFIKSPDLRFIVSNTTEAGIRYEEDDVTADEPRTFPGKIVSFLYRRFRHFNGDMSKGIIFICCELIEDNGTTLHEYVCRHAVEAGLGDDFIGWVNNACIFCDTLVDRIVPGFPFDTINEIKEELGYDDNLVVKGELYHMWAIGGKDYEKVREELPLDKAGLHVLFMPSIKSYRDKKVRILNGSHTGMVPIALQLGCETVMDAFNNANVNKFINTMVSREVLPMIDENIDELKKFADGILERFYNPYIKHMLKSIALNSLSKWEARNWSTVKDFRTRTGGDAEFELFTFASLLSLYAPGSGFSPEDTPEHVAYIREVWNDDDIPATVAAITGSNIFVERFEESVPGFSAKVAEYVGEIRRNGMEKALARFLDAHE